MNGRKELKIVTVVVQPNSDNNRHLLVPCGFDDGFSQPIDIVLTNVKSKQVRESDFGEQKALELVVADSSKPTTVEYHFAPSTKVLVDSFWARQQNRYSQASDALIADVRDVVDTKCSQEEQIHQLIQLAHSHFNYGHADTRFNDNTDFVPSVCGTTKGSCVDMNTYILAGANVLNLQAQYIAGYWFHPDKTQTLDMHCWLLFNENDSGNVIPWDLAHHLKWGVEQIAPGLNPAGGRRVPMSFGRGLSFESEFGKVTISHFSEPVWLLPNGDPVQADIVAFIDD